MSLFEKAVGQVNLEPVNVEMKDNPCLQEWYRLGKRDFLTIARVIDHQCHSGASMAVIKSRLKKLLEL